MEQKKSEMIRTTIWLPRSLHGEVKRYAIYCQSNMTSIIRIALRQKLDQLKKDIGKTVTNKE